MKLPNVPGSLLHSLGLYVAAGCLAWGWLHARDTAKRREGALMERNATITHERDRLLTASRETTILYQRDTVVVKKLIQRWDTLTVDRHLTDTVWVAKALDTADSVKRACVRVLADCNVLLAQKDTLIDGYRKQLSNQTKLTGSSKFGLAGKLLLAGAAGWAAHAIAAGH